MDGNTDPTYHRRTLDHGVSIAFDRIGLQNMVGMPSDGERIAVLSELIKGGYAEQIMLSHDTIWHWLGRPPVIPEPVQQLLASWQPTHIFDDILPALRDHGVTDAQIRTMQVDNPRRLFSRCASRQGAATSYWLLPTC